MQMVREQYVFGNHPIFLLRPDASKKAMRPITCEPWSPVSRADCEEYNARLVVEKVDARGGTRPPSVLHNTTLNLP
jgi:hypothetical protein